MSDSRSVCEFCEKWEDRCECDPAAKRLVRELTALKAEHAKWEPVVRAAVNFYHSQAKTASDVSEAQWELEKAVHAMQQDKESSE